jgi:hypothetical protein
MALFSHFVISLGSSAPDGPITESGARKSRIPDMKFLGIDRSFNPAERSKKEVIQWSQ